MSVFPKTISILCPVTADQAATGRSKRISSSLAKLAALEFGYDEEYLIWERFGATERECSPERDTGQRQCKPAGVRNFIKKVQGDFEKI